MLISALKTLAPSRFPVVIDGYHFPADGGEGIFRHHYTLPDWATWIDFDRSGPHEDGGLIIQSLHDGYWIRRHSDAINVRWFGATGDGVSDDSDAFAKASIAARSLLGTTATVYFPQGVYKGHFITEDVTVLGDGVHTIITAVGQYNEVIKACSNFLRLRNLTIMSEEKNCISIGSCEQQFSLDVENVIFKDCPKDIVQLHNEDSVTWIDYSLNNIAGVKIYDSNISSLKLAASSATFYNCLQDAMANGYHKTDIDEASSVEVYMHNYNYPVGDELFVHSIGHDGSFDVHQLSIPTSVRGPLRSAVKEGNAGLLMSEHFEHASDYTFDADSTVPLTQTIIARQVDGGVLKDKCIELTLQPFNVVKSRQCFSISKENNHKYYAWSVHAYLCSSDQENTIAATMRNNLGESLGQVIFSPGEWICSYGVKHMQFTSTGDANDSTVHLYIDGGEHGGTIRLCDWQVVVFDTLKQATDFANSRLFALV